MSKYIVIGIDKKQRINAAVVDEPDNTEVNKDIADMVRSGLRVIRIKTEHVTLGDYWIE